MSAPAPDGAAKDPSTLHKVLVGVVFLAAVALVSYVASRPAATAKVADAPWAVQSGEALALTLPAGGQTAQPIFTLTGPIGGNVLVDVPQGQISAAAPPELLLGQPQLAGRTVPIQWSMGAGGQSRALVVVELVPKGAAAASLTLIPRLAADVAELQLTARNAELHVTLSGVATGQTDDPTASLTIADPQTGPFQMQVGGGGALPVPLVVQPGQQVTIRYAKSAAAGASFELGAPGLTVTALRLDRASGPLASQSVRDLQRLYACGAAANQWVSLALDSGQIACRPTLAISSLALGADGLKLAVDGFGFITQDGHANVVSFETLQHNALLTALFGLVISGIAGWAYTTVIAPIFRARRAGS